MATYQPPPQSYDSAAKPAPAAYTPQEQEAVTAQPCQGQIVDTAPQTQQQMPWTYGICSCLEDTDECLDTCFCTYCKFGRMAHRLEHNEVGFNWMWCSMPLLVDIGMAAAFYFLFGGGGGGLGTVLATSMLRRKLQLRYDIREGGCESAIYAVCIPVCALCQQSREMGARGEFCGGTLCSKPPAENAPVGSALASQQPQQQQQYQQYQSTKSV